MAEVALGQVRRWSLKSDEDYGKCFMIIGRLNPQTRGTSMHWRIMQGEGTTLWSVNILAKWSEVILDEG